MKRFWPELLDAGVQFIAVVTVLGLLTSLFPLCTAQTIASTRTNRIHDPNAFEPLTIVIRPEGFSQKAIQVPRGRYSLGIFNRSGLDDLTLELERMPGKSIEGAASERTSGGLAAKRVARWLQRVELLTGTYRLRVANRPSWVCAIEVQ